MKKIKKFLQNYYAPLIGSILLIAFNIGKLDRYFTTDEIWNVKVNALSNSELLQKILNDVHPPLFFIIQKAYSLVFGNSEIALHSFSLFFAVAAIWVFHSILKEILKNPKAIVLGTLLFSISPLFLSQAIFARWYSFFACLVLLSYLLFFKTIDSNRCNKWIGIPYILVTIAGIYTNYLMIPIIGLQFITALFLKKKEKDCHICAIMVGCISALVAFTPWMLAISGNHINQGVSRYLNEADLSIVYKFGYLLFNQYLGPLIFVGKYALVINLLLIFIILSVSGIIKIKQMKNLNVIILIIHGGIISLFMSFSGLILPHYLVFINFIFLFPLIFLIKLFKDNLKILPFALIIGLWLPSYHNFFVEKEWHITNATDNWESVVEYAKKYPDCQKIIIDKSKILEFYFEKEDIKNYVFVEKEPKLNNSKCTILVRTYLGKWKEGYDLSEKIDQKLRKEMTLKEEILINKDENSNEKNKLINDLIYYPEHRICILNFTPK